MGIETVIFDLDGTIVDTEGLAASVIDRWAINHQVSLQPGAHQHIAGVTWEKGLATLISHYRVNQSLEGAVVECLRGYRSSLLIQIKVIPGVLAAIESLSKKMPLGLVSGSHREDIEAILASLKIREKFEVVLGCEDYEESKPSPSGFLKAMKLMKASCHSTLIFEDSKPGISSALAAGAWVTAVAVANHFGHDQSQAHCLVQDFSEVNLQWVQNWKRS